MLVLESLEKAEVDVADELLGEDSTLCVAVCSSLSAWASVTDLLQSPFTGSSPTWCWGWGGGLCTPGLILSWGDHTGHAQLSPWVHTTDLLAANPTEPACGC